MNNSYEKIEGLFIELMGLTISETIKKLKSGEADAKDVRNAITLLKDNGFTLRDVPMDKDPNIILAEISTNLPSIGAYGEILDE